MPEREFSHYEAVVTAGPGRCAVDVVVRYWDLDDEPLGAYGEHMIAFCTTWKDAAEVIRKGLKLLGYDTDVMSHVSPMVDLS